MLLTTDSATSLNNTHLCIPLKINTANNIDDDLIAVNNFLVHFTKEIDIRRYIQHQHKNTANKQYC